MSTVTFGTYFKEARIKAGATLRAFCAKHGYDPGNISKLERGRLAPPNSEDKLAGYATALALQRNTPEWQEFFDRAAAERGRIPNDLLSDAELLEHLPALFRTLRGKKVGRADLDNLIDRIRRA